MQNEFQRNQPVPTALLTTADPMRENLRSAALVPHRNTVSSFAKINTVVTYSATD